LTLNWWKFFQASWKKAISLKNSIQNPLSIIQNIYFKIKFICESTLPENFSYRNADFKFRTSKILREFKTCLPICIILKNDIPGKGKRRSRFLATAFIIWRPQGDLNPCRRRERPVSWARLDDGDTYSEPGGARTLGHRIKSPMLYQLSYWLNSIPPISWIEKNIKNKSTSIKAYG
jgi:hypothetical protein